MIIITGASGFIGSCLVKQFNELDEINLVLVDKFGIPNKARNLVGKRYAKKVERTDLFDWLEENGTKVSAVVHLGARTDTTEKDKAIFDELNLSYSKKVWNFCVEKDVPLVYASSAATYGDGAKGYKDDHEGIADLQPLNPYGWSKQSFDTWALEQESKPTKWYGLKFFNVYGPNEYHKGRMASVIYHTHKQISETGKMNLFRSHRSEYEDGKQLRDFIYVKDIINVITFLLNNEVTNGIYNLGTGQARTFNDLAEQCFKAMNLIPYISYVDIPEDIRDSYQYYTQAEMKKLTDQGYDKPFTTLEEGVADYVDTYLKRLRYF